MQNWRWSHYWFGATGIDDVYVEHQRINALVFWSKQSADEIRGICSTELTICVAYIGRYFDPKERRMSIDSSVGTSAAFIDFVKSGFRDASHPLNIPGLHIEDFSSQMISMTLPDLGPPDSIAKRNIPQQAFAEAQTILPRFASDSRFAKLRIYQTACARLRIRRFQPNKLGLFSRNRAGTA